MRRATESPERVEPLTDEERRAAGLPGRNQGRSFQTGLMAGLGIGVTGMAILVVILLVGGAAIAASIFFGSLDFIIEAFWGR